MSFLSLNISRYGAPLRSQVPPLWVQNAAPKCDCRPSENHLKYALCAGRPYFMSPTQGSTLLSAACLSASRKPATSWWMSAERPIYGTKAPTSGDVPSVRPLSVTRLESVCMCVRRVWCACLWCCMCAAFLCETSSILGFLCLWMMNQINNKQ